MRLDRILRSFLRAQDGATIVEYALLIALIGALSIAAWTGIGDGLKTIFDFVTSYLV